MSEQTYKNFEVIVLPNKMSGEDKTLLSKYLWLKIIQTGKITRPAQKETSELQMLKDPSSHSLMTMHILPKIGLKKLSTFLKQKNYRGLWSRPFTP